METHVKRVKTPYRNKLKCPECYEKLSRSFLPEHLWNQHGIKYQHCPKVSTLKRLEKESSSQEKQTTKHHVKYIEDLTLTVIFEGCTDKDGNEMMTWKLRGYDVDDDEDLDEEMYLENFLHNTNKPRVAKFEGELECLDEILRFPNTLSCNITALFKILMLQSVHPAPVDCGLFHMLSKSKNAMYLGYYDHPNSEFDVRFSTSKDLMSHRRNLEYGVTFVRFQAKEKIIHFFMILFSFKNSCVSCYDSSVHYYTDEERKTVVLDLVKHLQSFKRFHFPSPTKITTLRTVAQQPTEESCGGMVLYFVDELLKSDFTSVPTMITEDQLQDFLCKLIITLIGEQTQLPANLKGLRLANLLKNKKKDDDHNIF